MRPMTPEQAARKRKTSKRVVMFGCAPLAAIFFLVVVLAAIGSTIDDNEPGEPSTPVPAYTVTNKREKASVASVDLVAPDVTVSGAKAAIKDYADGVDSRFEEYDILVVRSATAKVYVCWGRWIRDETSSKIHTGGAVQSDTWPALDVRCPDPEG